MCDASKMVGKLNHLGISAPKDQFESIVEWYKAALASLNYKEHIRFPGVVGLGDNTPDFWIAAKDNFSKQEIHFAFTSPDHATVDAFHKAAVAAGGTCNGPPGPRPQYHEHYYGAFVLDPVGNNVEVVDHCSHPEESK